MSPRRRIPYIFVGLTALLLWGFVSVADEVTDGETLAFETAVTGFFREAGNPNDPEVRPGSRKPCATSPAWAASPSSALS